MTTRLQDRPRLAIKAAIKRASARARQEMQVLDRARLAQLDELYRRAGASLHAAAASYAGTDGSIRLETLNALIGQVESRLNDLSQARNQLLEDGLIEAARIGVAPMQVVPGVGIDTAQVAEDAVRFVHRFVAEDGLQLSDRIWRLDRNARETVTRAIESAVIQGHSASQAATDFLARGADVPADLRQKMRAANADAVGRSARSALLTDDEISARANAMRVFRTGITRAHGQAYREAGLKHPDVIGTRFLLSPNHPRVDVCDMHASANLYGLGPGVYPPGKSPWPAHPNTLSFEEVVFADEVTDDDHTGREDRISWLKRQEPEKQVAVLQSRKKASALRRDILKQHEIGTPWRVLQRRYRNRGIDIDAL